jgi:hypothetical protein
MTLTLHQLYEICAQETHALIGAFLFYLMAFYLPGNLLVVGVVFGVLAVIETFKEFWWDIRNEPGETYLSGAIDFSFYYVGALAGFIGLMVTHRLL